jgi:transcriptional regulator with XRE-family HTH domain
MSMEIVRLIRDKLGFTKYRMGQELGVSTTAIYQYEDKAESMRLDVLCRLRQVSGMSWNEFGKMLDGEFGEGFIRKKARKE